MNFNLFVAENFSVYDKTKKKKTSFLTKKNNEVELFHMNKLSSIQLHAVFYISDEYKIGTKNSGDVLSVPFNQYVNTFMFSNSSLFLVEAINNSYTDMVIKNIESNTKNKIKQLSLSNTQMLDIVLALKARVKKIEYEFEDEYFEVDFTAPDEYSNVFKDENDINYLLIDVENKLMSIKDKKTISVNNSEEDYLIKFTEEIINAIKI